ncbi:MAG: hypothetical protein WBA54_13965 [Acidaminobacteraceae bacterium]
MKIKDITSKKEWEDFFRENDETPIHSSSAYIEYLERIGLKIKKCKSVNDSGDLNAIWYSAYDYKKLTYYVYGPYLSIQNQRKTEISRSLLIDMIDSIKNKFINRIILNNDFYGTHGIYDNCGELLKSSGFSIESKYTYLVDLDLTSQDLFSSFKRNLRKSIRQTEKNLTGYEFFEFNNCKKDAKEFYTIINQNRIRNSITPYVFDEVYAICYDFRMFGIRNSNGLLCVLGAYTYSDYVIEAGIGTSNYAYDNKMYVGDLLKWKMMEKFSEEGLKKFDLAGFEKEPKDEKEAGIAQYKAKWGGVEHEYKVYKSVPNAITIIKKIKTRILKKL